MSKKELLIQAFRGLINTSDNIKHNEQLKDIIERLETNTRAKIELFPIDLKPDHFNIISHSSLN